MYAIELFLDSDVEGYVRRVWTELHNKNISSFMFNIEELRPHITLAVYKELDDLATFKNKFKVHCNNHKKLDIKLDMIGTFPTSGTCFLAPTITKELLNLHSEFHKKFEAYSHYANPYYTPNNWEPHCTLATKLTHEKLVETINYCTKDFKPFKSTITEIGIVEITFEGDQCVSSPTIYSERCM
ncbi:2'-5' RNA ligase family protein [Paenibacillus agricola]|uniref:2'-5' RNA ligase family protein n=1 Tax=Paenibacillus agricola TaxID=2716264 RepID=A0ABX0J8X4_9BACL|nr:2'-5' RNA ligase family protein [Paenibacillus agricola]NHN32819.1 2'-5' RNA ligase family protein [Paenibacillus agricola]